MAYANLDLPLLYPHGPLARKVKTQWFIFYHYIINIPHSLSDTATFRAIIRVGTLLIYSLALHINISLNYFSF